MVFIFQFTSMYFLALLFCCAVASPRQIYHIQVARSMMEQLQQLYPSEIDIWNEIKLTNTTDPLMDLTVYTTSTFVELLKDSLLRERVSNFAIRQEPVDMEALIATEKESTQACRENTANFLSASGNLQDNEFFDCFRPHEEIFAFLDKMVTEFPDNLIKEPISTTIEGRTIYRYTISTNFALNREAIFIQGLLHAREWLSIPTCVYSMAMLLDGIKNNDATAMAMLNIYDFHFVPIVNIDGYEYTWTKSRMWRKNRRPGTWASGVDLNRNYGPERTFCGSGASSSPWSETYCGKAAFSEPEIAGIEEFITRNEDRIAGGIDVHCYGYMVLRPYGLSYNPIASPHKEKMEALGANITNTVNAHANGRFTNMRASELYVASGTFLDSLYESHGQKPSITFELRGDNFVVDPSLIRISGPEIYKGLEVFVHGCNSY